GWVPWGYDVNAPDPNSKDSLNPVPIVKPTLKNCPAHSRCCSFFGTTRRYEYLEHRRWECATKCPFFGDTSEV
ncbi:hypothetical protein PMAYCL1PPCAC_09970, partial [Pristionchus mayeri]